MKWTLEKYQLAQIINLALIIVGQHVLGGSHAIHLIQEGQNLINLDTKRRSISLERAFKNTSCIS